MARENQLLRPIEASIIARLHSASVTHHYHRSQENAPPIYTLTVLGSRLYIVNTPELIKSVQRQPKVLAFPPIEAKFAMTVCASSKEANDILKVNVNGDAGDWGYSMDFYKSLHTPLAPGPGLDGMNRIMISNIAASCEKLRRSDGEPMTIQLVEWLRHEVTLATTNSVYGPNNPFKSIEVQNAFWYSLTKTCSSDAC